MIETLKAAIPNLYELREDLKDMGLRINPCCVCKEIPAALTEEVLYIDGGFTKGISFRCRCGNKTSAVSGREAGTVMLAYYQALGCWNELNPHSFICGLIFSLSVFTLV